MKSHSLPYDIYALTETNLTPDFNSNELFPSEFNTFRADINSNSGSNPGRGVLLAVHNRFNTSLLSTSSSPLVEFVTVKISTRHRNLFILCCYIRPAQSIDSYKFATETIDSLVDRAGSEDEIIVLGDFNLPYLQWSPADDESHYVPLNASSASEILIADHFLGIGLFQISNVKNHLCRQLDLIFSSNPSNSLVTESNHLLSTLDLHHPPLLLTLFDDSPIACPITEPILSFNFRAANYDELNSLLSRPNAFSYLNNPKLPVDTAVQLFYAELFSYVQSCVPLSTVKTRTSSPPWYNKDLRSLRNKRNKLWRVFLSSRSDSDYSSYLITSSLFAKCSELRYRDYLNLMQIKLTANPRQFYSFINMKSKSNGYPSFLNFGDSSSSDPSTIADYFASFFAQSFCDDTSDPDPSFFQFLYTSPQTSITSIPIDPSLVASRLALLIDDFNPGPDGIPSILLKKCSAHLIDPLNRLFNLSLAQGTFPRFWKDSYITPIHKKGCRSVVSNYRPIAKLSSIPKLFESLIYDIMSFHCKSIISHAQHGFLKGRSTTTNLTVFVSHALQALESHDEIDVVATDFSKAFDKISHKIIILKLNALGFPPLLISWVKSYLTNRKYMVRFCNAISKPFQSHSGVPQGSHLGPLLFILSINDVVQFIRHSEILIYADDIKIFKRISNDSDPSLLQDDLNRFSSWCSKNLLRLNISKCQSITYSRKHSPSPCRTYILCGEPIPSVSSIRDLGVICDRELNFRSHIENIINKANSALGYIKRWSKEFSNPYVTKSLFTCFVRPLLEYASQVWSPHQKLYIDRIESVQRRFIRFALRDLPWSDNTNLPPYENRLQLINLQPLSQRRDTADIIFIHQVLSGSIDCPSILQYISLNTNPRRLRSSSLFRLPSHRTNYGHYEPITRMLRKANSSSAFDFHIDKTTLRNALSQLLRSPS